MIEAMEEMETYLSHFARLEERLAGNRQDNGDDSNQVAQHGITPCQFGWRITSSGVRIGMIIPFQVGHLQRYQEFY